MPTTDQKKFMISAHTRDFTDQRPISQSELPSGLVELEQTIQSCTILRDPAIGSQSHLVSNGKFAKVGHEFG